VKRAVLALAGTVAGTAGVLSFPVQKSQLALPVASSAQAGTRSTAAASTTPASPAAAGASPAAQTSRSATGSDVTFRYGDVAVKVTVQGARITKVQTATLNETDGRSYQIDSYAVPQLEQQVLAANSARVNGVSGATYTSQAFVDSLSSALQKLGFS
jgi:uncharacterized protein with FMN-binding domain